MSIRRLACVLALAIAPAMAACSDNITDPHPNDVVKNETAGMIQTENPPLNTGVEDYDIVD